MNFAFDGRLIEDAINNNLPLAPYTPPARYCHWSNCNACSLNNPWAWTVNRFFNMDYSMVFGVYEQLPATTKDPVSSLYACELCDEHVPESELSRHQCGRHPHIPLTTNIYKQLDDNASNGETPEKVNEEELPFVCVECQQKVWIEELEQHRLRYHPNVPSEVNIYRIAKENK